MSRVVAIVEGDGEVGAVPVLLRRIGEWRSGQYVEVPAPIRVRRDRFLNKEEEFRRFLLLAAQKCRDDGWILILLDADDDCPATRGAEILERARRTIPHRRVSVVLANREFESWFVAAATALVERGKLSGQTGMRTDAESIRNAKGWIKERMVSGSYSEVIDQPALTAALDLPLAHVNSRSFRKLCAEWDRQSKSELPPCPACAS